VGVYLLLFSTLGGVDTWVQHLYTVPQSADDKRQVHGNMAGTDVRRWVLLEHWLKVVNGVLALTSGVWHSHRAFGTPAGLGRWFETWVALI